MIDVASPADIAFVCTDLVVRFGSVHALDGCSTTLPDRGAVSVIGENGSGKSTLLDVLSGFVALSSGSVTNGEGTKYSRAALRRVTCRLHQRVVLPPELSVHEYLSICARAETAGKLSTPESFFAEGTMEKDLVLGRLLAEVGVGDSDVRLQFLSWGQSRIVAVCGILATPKRTVLLDEPFAGLARRVRDVLMDVLEHAAHTRLVLFSEHDLRYAARADHVIVLKGGRVVQDVPAEEFRELPPPMEYYGD